MKKLILFILAFVVAIVPGLILADNDTSIAYLQGQNQSSWISQALASVEVANLDISYIDYDTNDLMTAAKNILTLAAVQSSDMENIKQLVSVVIANKNNGQFGDQELLNDDFWSVLALASVDKLENTEDVKTFILDHQNSDGGWSWASSGTSDSNDTAAAIMALVDLGYGSNSTEINNALNYLASTQNNDGGFAYDTDSLSDGASTAWVISALNKLDVEPATWQRNDNNPISFLESLRRADGSFLWMTSDSQGSIMVTAYALLALNGSTYPVNYIELLEVYPIGNTLRIEGPGSTICLASNLESLTVMDILEAGVDVCGYEYLVEDTDYGPYVSSIDGILAEGLEGWQYFVDFEPGLVAADEYLLSGGQEVLWAYGTWPLYATRLEVNDTQFDVEANLVATFSYYDGDKWLPLSGANIMFADTLYQTDGSGQINFELNRPGAFVLYSQASDNYVRSNRKYIIVGDGVSQAVDLLVNVSTGSIDPGAGNTIAFNVDRSNIDFGTLNPGQSADTLLTISNTGNTNIYIEASVVGDSLFQDHTSLNQSNWQDYSLNLGIAALESLNVALEIPQDFSSSGVKEGQLIFWGINQ